MIEIEFEFEVTCKHYGASTWIYGTLEDEDYYDKDGYTCIKCRDKERKNSSEADNS